MKNESEILRRAQELISAADLKSAEEFLATNIEQFSKSAALHFVLGNVYLKTGKYNEAIICYKNSERINPEFSIKERLYNLGICYFYISDYDNAERQFIETRKICPNMLEAEKKLAIVFYYQNRYEESSKCLERILEESEEDKDLFYWLGLDFQSLGKHESAIEYFTVVLEHIPHHALAWSAMALSYWIIGDDANALRAVEKSLSFDIRHCGVLMNVSRVLADLGQINRVLKLFRKYLEQNPEDQDAKAGYATFLAADGNIEQAMAIFRNATEGQIGSLHGAEADFWEVLHKKGEYEYALEVCKLWLTAQRASTEHPVIKEKLSLLIESLTHPQEALQVILSFDETLLQRTEIKSTKKALETVLGPSSSMKTLDK